jgi:hypothetical protein
LNEKEAYIRTWIKEVSKIRPELGNFAICPFASNAKFIIEERNIDDIKPLEGYDVVIFIVEDHLSLDVINHYVNLYNNAYENWDFFEDCASYDTFINEIKTNNGRYNLILGQPKEKLKKFREKLAKTEYYDNWDDEYLREILKSDYDLVKRDSNPLKSSDFN